MGRRKEGREEGRKEGRKGRRKGGREGGMKERRKKRSREGEKKQKAYFVCPVYCAVLRNTIIHFIPGFPVTTNFYNTQFVFVTLSLHDLSSDVENVTPVNRLSWPEVVAHLSVFVPVLRLQLSELLQLKIIIIIIIIIKSALRRSQAREQC